jgi:hypothetical protein
MKVVPLVIFLAIAVGVYDVTMAQTVKPVKLEVKKFEDQAPNDRIAKLQRLVQDTFNEPQDGYIELSDREFLILASNTGRIGLGIYFADLEKNKIDDDLVAYGAPTLLHSLSDKSGKPYLLFNLFAPAHGGYWGWSYTLLSARKSSRGNIRAEVEDLASISQAEEGDDDKRLCGPKKSRERYLVDVVDEKQSIVIKDISGDEYPDIRLELIGLDCKTMKRSKVVMEFVASVNGFILKGQATAPQATKRLLDAHKRAIELFSKAKNLGGLENENDRGQPRQTLEDAGVKAILDHKPQDMRLSDYVAILNDYAFFVTPWGHRNALEILDHVIQLDPRRGVAYLNRAEVLLYLLRGLETQDEKMNASREITADYKKYKELTGKQVEKLERFSSFNLAKYPQGTNVCSYIKSFVDAEKIGPFPRIDEVFLETERLDINNDGIIDDVKFESPDYGYKTYGGFSIKNESGIVTKIHHLTLKPELASGEGFRIFSFEGKAYKLHARDVVGIILGDKEIQVCEPEFEIIFPESKDEDLCRAVVDGAIEYVKPGMTNQGNYPLLDLDNDGKKEAVASVLGNKGHVRKRPFHYVASVDPQSSQVRSDDLNKALFDLQRASTCKGMGLFDPICSDSFYDLSPFVFRGKTYFDKYHVDEKWGQDPIYRNAYRIVHGQSEKLCNFQRKLVALREVKTH